MPEVEHDRLAHVYGHSCRGCEELEDRKKEALARYERDTRFMQLVRRFCNECEVPDKRVTALIVLLHQLFDRHLRNGRAPGPVRHLRCCACGAEAGRWCQHWNRDTGYGVCFSCVGAARARGASDGEILDLYGAEGVNWGPPP